MAPVSACCCPCAPRSAGVVPPRAQTTVVGGGELPTESPVPPGQPAPQPPTIPAGGTIRANTVPVGTAVPVPNEPLPTPATDVPTAALQAVAGAHAFFARYGLGAEHGNGAIRIEFASSPESFTAYLPDRDIIRVAHNPVSGRSEAYAGDVLAHEYAHRVMEKLVPGLGSASGQAGAVSESLADTIAAAVDPDDWTIGEDVIPGGGRSLSSGMQLDRQGDRWVLRQQPAHMSHYVTTDRDNGGTHINAGIPSRAAYLIGSALGREAMADIYMGVLGNRLITPASDFQALANATWTSALIQFGAGSRHVAAVEDAWRQVGIEVQPVRAVTTSALTAGAGREAGGTADGPTTAGAGTTFVVSPDTSTAARPSS